MNKLIDDKKPSEIIPDNKSLEKISKDFIVSTDGDKDGDGVDF